MSEDTEAVRRCRFCGESKPVRTGFYRQHKKRFKCRDCNRRETLELRRERSEFLTAYKLERGCMDCGYRDHPAALDLDHRPGEVKLIEGSALRFRGTWQQMLDELAKCDVVCSNCHRVRTFSRPPAMRDHDLLTLARVAMPVRSEDPSQLDLFDA